MRRMHRTVRIAFPALLSSAEKEMLVSLAERHQMTMCAVLRQLILREAARGSLIHSTDGPSHEKTLRAGR